VSPLTLKIVKLLERAFELHFKEFYLISGLARRCDHLADVASSARGWSLSVITAMMFVILNPIMGRPVFYISNASFIVILSFKFSVKPLILEAFKLSQLTCFRKWVMLRVLKMLKRIRIKSPSGLMQALPWHLLLDIHIATWLLDMKLLLLITDNDRFSSGSQWKILCGPLLDNRFNFCVCISLYSLPSLLKSAFKASCLLPFPLILLRLKQHAADADVMFTIVFH
jgi:hypothetical protein